MIFPGFFYIIAIVNSTLTVLLTSVVVKPNWIMPAGMFMGMFLGLAVMGCMCLLVGWLTGPFELVAVGMFVAKIAGMGAGMWITMGHPGFYGLLIFAIITGGITQGIFHWYDLKLHGEVLINDEVEG